MPPFSFVFRVAPLRMALAAAIPLVLIGLVIGRARAEDGEPATVAPRTTDLATAFTYQGRVAQDGVPIDGTCDFRFAVFAAPTGGVQLITTVQQLNVAVTGGLFTTTVDLGSAVLQGEDRYLETSLRCPAGASDFVALAERQALTPTPYSIRSLSTTNDQVGGGGGDGWSLTGNAGTNPATNFVGTTDNTAFEIRANNSRVYRLEPNATSPNIIGGSSFNTTGSLVVGATISGGGSASLFNAVLDSFGTVGGGRSNLAGSLGEDHTNATFATVGGGENNWATGEWSTISGGQSNTASFKNATIGGGESNIASGLTSTISGGYSNTASGTDATIGGGSNNSASAQTATVGGGYSNVASVEAATVGGGYDNTATGDSSTVAGGWLNTASGTASAVGGGFNNQATKDRSVIAGGSDNLINGDGEDATIGGGYDNTVTADSGTVAGGWLNTVSGAAAFVGGGYGNTASGLDAMVVGGFSNTASGDYGFASGRRAKAVHFGSFVWGDGTDVDISSPGDNTFSVRAGGGIWLGTTSSPSIPANRFIQTSTLAYLTSSGVWTSNSDVNLKTNFSTVDTRSVLETLMEMPVTTWNYKVEGSDVLRMGPMAQDFYAAFGLGDSDKAIGTVDAQGVAFAAIQGLYETVQDENAGLRAENAALESRIERLESAAGFAPERDAAVPAWAWVALALLAGVAGGLVGRKAK